MLQDLYDSEINAAVFWNWDGGFEVRMGNGIYGDDKNWEASDNVGKNYDDVEAWFTKTAKEMYPDSQFVRNLPDYSGVLTDFLGEDLQESLDKLTIRGK